MDQYKNFADLQRNETRGKDYRIVRYFRNAPVTIIAPHGGLIEPGTSLITRQIAGQYFNYYCFEGIKPSGNYRLHITSHRFDEPSALSLARTSDLVVTVHACKGEDPFIIVGGSHTRLAAQIKNRLKRAGYHVPPAGKTLRGRHPANICNRGNAGKGIQLELSRGIRDKKTNHESLAGLIRDLLLGYGGRKP